MLWPGRHANVTVSDAWGCKITFTPKMHSRCSKAICVSGGTCVVALVWMLCLLSRWISMNASGLKPRQMGFQDHFVEFVSEIFFQLYDWYIPHLLTLALLVWIVGFALRCPAQKV